MERSGSSEPVKLSSLMIQIAEYFDGNKPEVKVEGIPMKGIRKLLVILQEVPDFRKQHMSTYRLRDILLLAFLAMLGGSEGYTEIVDFWGEQKRLYRQLYKQAALPSHDTFRRVISLLEGGCSTDYWWKYFLKARYTWLQR